MRFGKDGKWSFGRENKELDEENDFAVLNILSLKEGYVCWEDNDDDAANKKLGEQMAPVNQPINPEELPDHGFPWERQQSIQMKFCEGAYEGTQTVYSPSSQGGLEVLGAVVDMVLARIEKGTPYFFPVVGFSNSSYIHKKWGKTYKPVIDIVGWADAEGNEDPDFVLTDEPEPKPKPKPAASRRAKAADKPKAPKRPKKEEPEPEPEPEEEPEEPETDGDDTPAEEQDAQPVTRRRRR